MPNYIKAYEEQGKGNLCVHQKKVSVKAYDMCRYIPEAVLDKFSKEILKNNPKSILEAGVGNGRFFVPILKKVKNSQELIGVDISKPMLGDLNNRIENLEKKYNKKSKVNIYCVDLRNKDFFKKYFDKNIDTIYTFATLHILSERWQDALDNLVDSLSKKGKLILGEEINAIFHGSEDIYENDDYRLTQTKEFLKDKISEEDLKKSELFFKEYHKLRNKLNFPFFRINSQILHGDQSSAERYLRSKGFSQKTIESKELTWLKPYSFEDILYCIENGTITTLGSDMPDDVRKSIKEELECFCKKSNYKLDEVMQIPSQIQLHTFS